MADADANSLDDDILTRDAALLKDTVREAGALALSMFRTELKRWIKGASSPVSEADIAVNDLLEARLPSPAWQIQKVNSFEKCRRPTVRNSQNPKRV